MADLEGIEQLLTDLNQRMATAPARMSEDEVTALIESVIATRLADPDDEFYRKLRFGSDRNDALIGSKFQRYNYTTADVEMLYDIQTAMQGQAKRHGGTHSGPSEELERAFRAVSDAYYLPMDEVRRIDQQAIDGMFPRVTRQNRAEYEAVSRAMDSAESGYGSQLIGAEYVGDLWDGARNLSTVFPLIPSFEMAHPTVYIPVEADLPEMLFVSENTANNSSDYTTDKTGSNRVQLNAKKFVLHQMWSGEMEEDSIIPYIPFLRRQATLALAWYSDSLVLNGDTTNAATGNINLVDADPADTKHYLAIDGIRHAALVDNTGNAFDASGAITTADLLTARNGMQQAAAYQPWHWGYPLRTDDLVHVMDFSTYTSLIQASDVVTIDKLGPQATLLSGQLASLWGAPIIPTQVISLTDATGMVSTTGSNNVKGQVVTFNRNGFRVGWRRRVQLETERLPGRDQTRLIYSLRLGFGRYSPTGAASGIEAAACTYNVTV